MKIKLIAVFVSLVIIAGGVFAQELVDRFASDEEFSHGTVVIQQDDIVRPASIGSDTTLLGVVRDDSSPALFSISNDGQQLDVVTSGVTDILVSTQNGPIEPGEQLAPSRLAGVATEAAGQSVLLGTALESFDGSDELVEVTLRDTNQPVKVGRIQARIDVRPNASSGRFTASAPRFVQNIADNIAGKPVAPIRAVSGLLIVIGTLLLAVSLFISLEVGAHDSKLRNPDATRAVSRSESQLLLIVFGVTVVGFGLAYLLLRTA